MKDLNQKTNFQKEDYAIEVNDVYKKFRVYHDISYSLKERALFRSRNKYEERWVLQGISMKIKKGEAVGLVGHNGCGKSTLLKMMTKIMYPDKGEIIARGRISSMIELGAGFHPDMSGRENIFTNAAILGLKKEEIERRIPEIIRFSELEDFIDNPVRTYSSGMYMRLAFAIAINVDADILLIDEILAVGDTNFQAKCFNKLREIKRQGTTIVIVSHSLGQIEQICDMSYWIDKGLIKSEGKPFEVHEDYMNYMNKKRRGREEEELEQRQEEKRKKEEEQQDLSEKESNEIEEHEEEATANDEVEDKKRWGTSEVLITDVRMLDSSGKESHSFEIGSAATVEFSYISKKEGVIPNIGFEIFRNDGMLCYGTNTLIDKRETEALKKSGIIQILLPELNLIEGVYLLGVAIYDIDGTHYDHHRDAYEFTTYSNIKDTGFTRMQHKWNF